MIATMEDQDMSLNLAERMECSARRPSARQRGFTVYELLISVTVLGVMAAITIPSFREISLNSATTGQVNDLVAALASARSEATKLSRPVRLSANGTWDAGWVLATDADRNGSLDGPDIELRTGDPARDGYQVIVADTGGTPVNHIWFNATGRLVGSAQPVVLTVRRPDGDVSKSGRLCVALSGRVESKKGENACL